MPEDLLERIVYLDITDSASSFGLNLFEVEPGADLTEIAKVASFVMHVFEKVWQVGPETPRLAQVLRNTTRVLLENPGMTFAEIPLLLWDDGVREKLVRGVTNTQTKLFWHQYNKKAPRDRDELIASTINKVDAYLNEPLIARIVSQSVSTINFRQIMDEGKILLVNLSPQLEEASRLIGAVLIGRLLMAAFSRADTPERERRPFLLFCDEYQRFATADFATLLSEARKFKLSTNLFNQTLEQLDDLNRATALQAGTLVVFRVSGSDSKDLAPSYDTTPTPELVGEEPVRAPVADVISHIVRHGSVNSVLKEFTTDYLLPLESLLQKVAAWPHPFLFGCREFRTGDLIDGRSRINDMLSQAMQQGRADIPLNPLALYTLCALANDGSAEVFRPYLIEEFFRPQEYLGFDISAWWLGKPGFLEETKAIRLLVLQHDKRGFFAVLRNRPPYAPAATAFLRVLKTFRETLAVLAQEPILTDTGLFQPKYQLRTYQDQENLVANELSQLPNYHAKVRLITGEHTIRTNPAPPAVSERKLEARIRAIKQHMLAEGVTKSAVAVEEEVRKRHEALRQRPPGDRPPPLNDNGKRPPTTGRGRSKHPPTND
jgi:hypothetical protein